jgi:hypothetical protein
LSILPRASFHWSLNIKDRDSNTRVTEQHAIIGHMLAADSNRFSCAWSDGGDRSITVIIRIHNVCELRVNR